MERQFLTILPPLESNSFPSSVEDEIYLQYRSAFDPDWIRDMIYKNQKSNSTNKANIYGLYVDGRDDLYVIRRNSS